MSELDRLEPVACACADSLSIQFIVNRKENLMSFLIVKELEGSEDEELASCSDPYEAVTEAISASQQDENLGSVITVMDTLSGACARLRADKLDGNFLDHLKEVLLLKLEKESRIANRTISSVG